MLSRFMNRKSPACKILRFQHILKNNLIYRMTKTNDCKIMFKRLCVIQIVYVIFSGRANYTNRSTSSGLEDIMLL